MKRRDVVRALLTPDAASSGSEPPAEAMPRVPSTAVRAMGLEIGRLAAEAGEASALRAQIASGMAIVDLDPALVDPSFVNDRLAPTEDADYRRLVDSIRQSGQQAPVLVRPHPAAPGRYQIAYGHRRRHAAAELGLKLRAIVRELSDAELVVAQGKENAERRNLSFIERALFAAHLEARGFDRRTLTAALAVHSAEMTRFLAVAAAVPAEIVMAIGPAPKAGRPRWLELAGLLADPALAAQANARMVQPDFRRLASDGRFDALLSALRDARHSRAAAAAPDILRPGILRNARDVPVIEVAHAPRGARIAVDERAAPGLSAFLIAELPALLRRFDAAVAAGDG